VRSATGPAGFRGLDAKFRRAAKQRFTSAESLLRNEMTLDAVYLGGYAAECAMKALILRNTRPKEQKATLSRICRGAVGHDLETLKAMLQERGFRMPNGVGRSFLRVVTWSTDLRYEVGLLRYNEAESFLVAVKDVVDWVEGSW